MANPAVLSLPVRAWRVDLAPDRAHWTCRAAGCPGAQLGRCRASQVALGHLGRHAAQEPLASHLRTCRCQAHGCGWHPRHRGCQGPVALTVFRSRGGAIWQLADACTACARAIPHAAQLPDRTAARPSPVHRRPPARQEGPSPYGSGSLRSLMTYLDAALLPGTGAGARLLALLCLLRAGRDGTVRLPCGLLRSWRLAHALDEALTELAGQHWVRHPPDRIPAAHSVVVAVADGTGVAVLRTTSRRTRRRLLDQAVRLLNQPHLRELPPQERLAVLRRTSDTTGTPEPPPATVLPPTQPQRP